MHIVVKEYDLKVNIEAVTFLRTMYNYGEEIAGILGSLDNTKKNNLNKITKEIAKNFPFLSFGRTSGRSGGGNSKKPTNSAMDPISEEDEEPLDADDVQSFIEKMDYKSFLPLFGVRGIIHQLQCT